MAYYSVAKPWTGRMDLEEDVRWHQRVRYWNLEKGAIKTGALDAVLLGFCCDAGVSRNKGRVGAAAAPAALRKAMSSFAWHFEENMGLIDAGDVVCEDDELEAAQAQMRDAVAKVVRSGALAVILGGGHETAWPSYWGLRTAIGKTPRVGVINLDAHFDLRKPVNGPTSGTPFLQMANWCALEETVFSYFCLGINPAGNTQSLFKRAADLGVEYITVDELFSLEQAVITKRLEVFIAAQDVLYLTIDLDGFDGSFAPGVSAVSTFGMHPQQMLPYIKQIIQSKKLKLVDVCELNPSYDIDQRTAKLGANLIFRVLKKMLTNHIVKKK